MPGDRAPAALTPRLRALCELELSRARQEVGLHELDGRVQDLSDAGVAAALARLGGPALPDPVLEAQLAAAERGMHVRFGRVQEHRRSLLPHLGNLDVSDYDRPYAPADERADTRREHLKGWPDGVDVAVTALDGLARLHAEALLGPVRGLAEGLRPDDPVERVALAAHARLVARVEQAAASGPDALALGRDLLAELLGTPEGLEVDLGRLETQADSERDRLRAELASACARAVPGAPVDEAVARLLADHPAADGVLAEAERLTARVIAFTREHELVPELDGSCEVGPPPPAQRAALAMLAWAGPYEQDGPSQYWITPPDPAWDPAAAEEWLAVFSRATLPGITLHEVAPGHFAHGRMLRRLVEPVRRVVFSSAFVEGWAHYVEELALELGFGDGDPAVAAGVALEALVRVTRLAVSIGLHAGSMTMPDAVARFERDAFLRGPAARSEALRATWDPTYGRYTWGKLVLRDLAEQARRRWGPGFSHQRLHRSLLSMGAPPLGLVGAALADAPGAGP